MTDEHNPKTDSQSEKPLRAVRFECSREFPAILEQLRISLLVATYQAGKLCVVGTHAGQLTLAFHDFQQVMGVGVSPAQIAVGTRRQVFFLHPAHEFAARLEPAGTYDACWLARRSVVTGSIHGHDLAWGQEGLWVVNTLFSCLCTLHEGFNFVPRWQPQFISQLIDQDRCHLNGLAMESGQPRFVTAMAESDEPAGWRPTKATSGCVIDVPSGETIARGLSMPHSPRLHRGSLWVLDSGRGRLSNIEPNSGRVQAVGLLPGYTRGLACHEDFAFVGLSRIRETSVFGGVPIAEHRDQLRCGVGVIQLSTGRTVATLQFHSGVEEIFAVEAVPGALNPRLCGPTLDDEHEREIWVVPAQAPGPARAALQSFTLAQGHRQSGSVQPASDGADAVAILVREGIACHEQGRLQEALERLRAALALAPHSAETLNYLGNLHQDMNDQPAALACYQRAVEVQPAYGPAHQNLGVVWTVMSEPHAALRHFESAQQAQPQAMNLVLGATVLPIIYASVDDVRMWRQRLEDRVQALVDNGVTIDTTDARIDTSFYFAYQGENDRGVMQNLARVYRGVECCRPATEGGWRPRGKRLRVGFVSSFFCNHTIGRLNLGRIQRLSRSAFEVAVISLRGHSDPMAQAFQQAADQYVQVTRQPSAARRQIAELQLDVLIFTDIGMDSLAQTLSYSRMAPIQCVTWGHPDTTGSPAIDYFLSSELLETEEGDDHYSEQLVRLPNLGTYYQRPEFTGPARSREFFGLDASRRVYLCPQTSFKFHPAFDEALAGILNKDPDGDLVVMEGRMPHWTRKLQQRWAQTLPDAQRRVRFVSAQPNADFLQLLSIADVALDPFPFGGGNTTYECLAVGTPVVTWPGRFLRGRIAYALYRRMNMLSAVAKSVDEYVNLAVQLASDRSRRVEGRRAIEATRGILFNNDEDIRVIEAFLSSLGTSLN